MYPPNQNFLPLAGQYPPSLLQGFILPQQNNNLSNNNNKPPPLMNQQHQISLMNQPPSLLTIPTPLIQLNNKSSNLPVSFISGTFNQKPNFGPVPLMSTLQSPLLLLQQQQQHPVSLLDLNPIPNLKNNLANEKSDQQTNPIKYKIHRYDLDSVEKLIENYENKNINDNIPIEIQTIDYNHGLSASTFSVINLTNVSTNSDKNNIIEQTQPKTPPPSLLSLKVAFSSKESSIKKSSSSNLFPILTESSHETTNQKTIPIESILHKPGRDKRPSRIVIILRGPPGSGKSFLSNLIKQEEEKFVSSSDKPKIISIDNYFINENEHTLSNNKKEIVMKYEYDKKMDESYQRSLIKSFKKTIDDFLFKFVIVDMINKNLNQIDEMSSYAKIKGFQTYVIDLNIYDAKYCYERNIHKRSLDDIKRIIEEWEALTTNYAKLDPSYFLKSVIKNENIETENSSSVQKIKQEIYQDKKNEYVSAKKFKKF